MHFINTYIHTLIDVQFQNSNYLAASHWMDTLRSIFPNLYIYNMFYTHSTPQPPPVPSPPPPQKKQQLHIRKQNTYRKMNPISIHLRDSLPSLELWTPNHSSTTGKTPLEQLTTMDGICWYLLSNSRTSKKQMI